MSASANERLAAARAAVDNACQLLLSPTPEYMDRSARLLESAIGELRNLRGPNRQSISMNPHEGRAAFDQVRLLGVSIRRTARLLEGAAAFHANWIRCLSALCAGYTGQGQPAAFERSVRMLAQG